MKLKNLIVAGLVLMGVWPVEADPLSRTNPPSPAYHIYAGNTHSHSVYTWSHGEQFTKPTQEGGEKKGGGIVVSPEGVQSPTKVQVLKPDWQKHQGPPSEHFALAKGHGYDFYAVTDHSQEAPLAPTSPTNAAWLATKKEAVEASDSHFTALAGYEYSENNGPGGRGHINVFNSAEYLNALAPGMDLPYLYQWLKTARPNGDGPVVASFNHPGPQQYSNWANGDPQLADIITLLEVINSNKGIHYAAFVNALDKGWKVSPICGNDNHGFWGITRHTSRTFLLATNRTKAGLLDAMKNRRTYASLDGNIQCRYTVNGAMMGSTLNRPTVFDFEITISDPDVNNPKDKIVKIDIVKDGGVVAQTCTPSPAFTVQWSPSLHDSTNKYFFVRVWNAGGGDAPGADPAKPVAWLAPVWTGR
ncbi:MAG: CehA/McbA family metallohydrolase [Verrucomicrobia bacterium]|nr:CehA/McbA family metallohydrolase [Verrucomicrobiota bacterium]